MRLSLLLVALFASLRPAPIEEIVETYPDGTVQVIYYTDSQGRRHGRYQRFRPDGTLEVKARYRAGLLDGRWESYHPSGELEARAEYLRGERHGDYDEYDADGELTLEGQYERGRREGLWELHDPDGVWPQVWDADVLVELDGVDVFPRTREEIAETLAELSEESAARGDDAGRALDRLRAYRYLSGVPWKGLQIDPSFSEKCQVGCRLLEEIGELTHDPDNPGWPEDEFEVAHEATSSSNLSFGRDDLVATIDGYMDDSDPSNIDRVGHRRWCLNPHMTRTGFGRSGLYSAMWAIQGAPGMPRGMGPVLYPAEGWYPASFVAADAAWSIRLPPSEYEAVDPAALRVEIWHLDEDYRRVGGPHAIEHLSNQADHVVFRAHEVLMAPGTRYWVEVHGLEPRDGGRLAYLVEFFSLEELAAEEDEDAPEE